MPTAGGSAKPKSAWQIETATTFEFTRALMLVRPNPNLPGRLKPDGAGRFRGYGSGSAKPKSAWQIETYLFAVALGDPQCSAKPKSAWQIETRSFPLLDLNLTKFGQTQICLAD